MQVSNGQIKSESKSRSVLLLDVLCILATAAFVWLIYRGNPTACCHARNALPLLVALAIYGFVSRRSGSKAKHWLAWVGFCIPALGLSTYLHLAFLLDWQQIATNAITPALLFQFLPIYVLFAGGIGAAIGWIVGRGIRPS